MKLSALFFPIMPYGVVFSKFNEWPSIEDLNKYKPKHVQSFLSHNICFILQQRNRNASRGNSFRENYKSLHQNSIENLFEPRIFLQGEVSTRRESWHDFFSTLIWYTFPKIKAALNMRQFIAFDERSEFPWKNPLKTRTREQDLLTMFEEGGCILVTLPAKNISIPFLYGHGFYEQIYYGNKDLTASTLEICIDMNILDMPKKEVLAIIDNKCAEILVDREYYNRKNAFTSIHIDNFINNSYVSNE